MPAVTATVSRENLNAIREKVIAANFSFFRGKTAVYLSEDLFEFAMAKPRPQKRGAGPNDRIKRATDCYGPGRWRPHIVRAMKQSSPDASRNRLEPFATPEPTAMAKPSLGACALFLLLVNGVAVGLLWLFGRPFLPLLEPLRLWSASFEVGANSQHLLDPYSFMHGVFGAGLYIFVDGLKPGWTTRAKLVVAVMGSAVWEVVENTPPVIRLFNESSQPGAYAGDSIVNSMSDTGCVILGFFVAQMIGWRATLFMAILIEVVLSLSIGDGLLLGALKVLGIV